MARIERLRIRIVAASVRLAPSEPQRVFGLTIVLGALCGLAAVAFHVAISFAETSIVDRAIAAPHYWWVLVSLCPAIGGLVVGLLLYYVAPSAAGSGIPQVKIAYALDGSRARVRDAISKFGLCVIQLGSGASLGREGPTVQICAGIASGLGRWLALSPANLRRLIPVGAAAGIAAAFNAPIAAVTFTIEEIVGSLDQTVLSGVVAAAALAAVVEHSILGERPVLFASAGAGFHHPSSLLVYALLGVAAALVSVLFTDLLLTVRRRARASTRVPPWMRPAIGGLVTGVLGVLGLGLVAESGVLGGGYDTLSRALGGALPLQVLALFLVLKLLATVSSYSSGGAGGIFAPTLFIGAMLGGLAGNLDVLLLGHVPDQELTSFALVGMGAVFAGVIRAPITSVLIVFEMTGGYGLVLPLMIANSVAYVLARRVRPVPIYEALLAQDGVVLPHGHGASASLASLSVGQAMTRDLVTLAAGLTLDEAAVLVAKHGHATYPVLREDGTFVGLLSEARLQRAIAEGEGARLVGDVARRKEYAVPDEPLLRAVARMTRLGVRQLPVLARGTHSLIGIIATSDVLRAQLRESDDATDRAHASSSGMLVDDPDG